VRTWAIGCTYKFLNGGPGSPAFIWVAEALQNRFSQPLSGWWSHAQPFEMAPDYRPADGIRRYLTGTQGILSMSVAELGLDIHSRVDMEQVREKSLALSDLFIDLVDERLADHPVEVVTPREHAHRGSQVSIRHPEGFAVMSALIKREVIGDYREPEVLRFGLTPLYLGFAEVWDTVEALRDILDNRLWDTPRPQAPHPRHLIATRRGRSNLAPGMLRRRHLPRNAGGSAGQKPVSGVDDLGIDAEVRFTRLISRAAGGKSLEQIAVPAPR
jgi:kynureninase